MSTHIDWAGHECAAELPPTPATKAERALSNGYEFRALLDGVERECHRDARTHEDYIYVFLGNFAFVSANSVAIEVTTDGWHHEEREPIGTKSMRVWCDSRWTSDKFEVRLKPKVLELLTELYKFVDGAEQRRRDAVEAQRRQKENEEDVFLAMVLGER